MRLLNIYYNPYLRQVNIYPRLEVVKSLLGKEYQDYLVHFLRKINRIAIKYGRSELREKNTLSRYIVIRGISSYKYAFLKRELLLLEQRFLYNVGTSLSHAISIYFSEEPLPEFTIAIYSSDLNTRLPRDLRCRILESISNLLSGKYELLGARYTSIQIGFLVTGSESLPNEISVNIDGNRVQLTFKGVHVLNYFKREDRDFIQRLLGRSLRRKLRKKGLRVIRNVAYLINPVYKDPHVMLYEGIEFQLHILDDGTVGLALSPKHEVTATGTLLDQYGSRDSLLADKRLKGKLVRRLLTWETRRIKRILDLKPENPIPDLGVNIIELYKRRYNIEVTPSHPDEPLIELEGVHPIYDLASMVKRVYTMQDLKELGISKEISRLARVTARDMPDYLSKWLSRMTPIELLGFSVNFSDKLPEVESI